MRLDTEKFAQHLRRKARDKSQGRCAFYVRLALQAGGARLGSHPGHAKEYGPTLRRIGFSEITVENPLTYKFMKGDIVVIQPYSGGNKSGHIAGFDGTQWISDFVQKDFWSGPQYRKHKPSHAFYRP
ncbi:hypothetical protein [Massilia niabensis]|uniref:Cytoplasmic protein n=1 Tax=Massilia niabensis TaxID=544910 RepID=A0ABW0L270_9BURK